VWGVQDEFDEHRQRRAQMWWDLDESESRWLFVKLLLSQRGNHESGPTAADGNGLFANPSQVSGRDTIGPHGWMDRPFEKSSRKWLRGRSGLRWLISSGQPKSVSADNEQHNSRREQSKSRQGKGYLGSSFHSGDMGIGREA
jgi:hypothetical protein